jgi:hypothetical protein
MNLSATPTKTGAERVLRCTCRHAKTLVDGDFRWQQCFDQIEACQWCRPDLYDAVTRTRQ